MDKPDLIDLVIAKAALKELQNANGGWPVSEGAWCDRISAAKCQNVGAIIAYLVENGEVRCRQRFNDRDCPGTYQIID